MVARQTGRLKGFCVWAGCFVGAFLTTAAVATQNDWLIALRGDSLLHLMLLVALCLLYRRALAAFAGRRAAFAAGLGFLLALCMAAGRMLGKEHPAMNILPLFIGYLPLFVACFALLLEWMDKRLTNGPAAPAAKPAGRVSAFLRRMLDGSWKYTLVVAAAAFVCWLPWFIIFYPGMVNDDVMTQVGQWFGSMSAHHPPLHTITLELFSRLGQALFGSQGAGFAMMSLFQMAAQAATVAVTARYMACLGIGFGWRLGVTLYYMLFPAFARYSHTLVKDVWLGLYALLFLLAVIEIMRKRAGFFRSPKRVVFLAAITCLLILSKNNALYIFAICAVCGVVVLRGCRLQMLGLLLFGVVFSACVTGPVYSALGITPGGIQEMLSVPLMQLGRAVLMDAGKNQIPAGDREVVREVLPYDELAGRYTMMIADPIKDVFDTEVFLQNPKRYVAVWLRIGMHDPGSYIRSFLEQSAGYWCPDVMGGLYMTKTYYQYRHDVMGNTSEPLPATDGAARAVTALIGVERNIPGYGLLYQPGFSFWVLLFCCGWLCYKKQYVRMLPFSLLFGVWLTCVASPLYAEFRYAWPAILCTPFLVAYTFGAPQRNLCLQS